jgi:hypothetical protein
VDEIEREAIRAGVTPDSERYAMTDQPGLWHAVTTGLSAAAGAVALITALWAFRLVARRWWSRSVGRRRAQTAILDQIVCTSSLAFVESKLGVPQFIRHDDDYEQRIYRLPGAWVTVEPVDSAVRAFTITITDANMYYETKGLTFGVVNVRLGKDTFDEAAQSLSEELAIGARHATYVRHYDSNNPGGFQQYWLAYNEVGAGTIAGKQYASGIYAASYTAEARNDDRTYGTPPDPAEITANTLTVLSPEGDWAHAKQIHKRAAHGPHIEHLRLLWTERKRLYRQLSPHLGRRLTRRTPKAFQINMFGA